MARASRPSDSAIESASRWDSTFLEDRPQLFGRPRLEDNVGPLDPPPDELSPDAYDVLLPDLGSGDLHGSVSDALNIAYLSNAEVAEVWPILGQVCGRQKRCMISVPVSLNELAVNVHFLFDTGSPATYLAQEVIDKLGGGPYVLMGINIQVNGFLMPLASSDDGNHSFNGLNILGMDFVGITRSTVTLDMSRRRFSIVPRQGL